MNLSKGVRVAELNPDSNLRCLLVNASFSENSYWNFKITCKLMDAKAPTAPLGLLTVAALLPQHWQMQLMDLNAGDFDQQSWDRADIIAIGGMLPQQQQMLHYLDKAKADGKFVIVGGADPSSQPDLYAKADALFVGEGEESIPAWIEEWRNTGNARGIFREKTKPSVSKTPIPRFDLLRFEDYLSIGVQYSRGCPFNCEFCDIIELYGRVPRTKSAEQLCGELQYLYDLGYRGAVDLVDDNFIGNKRLAKRTLLPALIDWQRKRNYPYFFATEASMNLADDKHLMRLMQAAQFRFVFVGIESPDPETLLQTQKSQNTMGDIATRISRISAYGMTVFGGFIMGFDSEKKNTDAAMIKLIEKANVVVATVGLLTALPNTQLTRRLKREGRLFGKDDEKFAITATIVDQTIDGLNFKTSRDRDEILQEYANVVQTIYDPSVYAERVIRAVSTLKVRIRHFPTAKGYYKQLKAFVRLFAHFSVRPGGWNFARVLLRTAPLGLARFEYAMRLMAIYLHLQNQTKYVVESIKRRA